MTFSFNTSGEVAISEGRFGGTEVARITLWRDLTPFVQGMVSGMLEDYTKRDIHQGVVPPEVGFADISGRAIARLVSDGELGASLFPDEADAAHGKELWMRRQRGDFLRFPMTAKLLCPFSIVLEDGKLVLADERA